MLPRDSDGIKSFQDTRTAFPPFLLHPGDLWEGLGRSQGKFRDPDGTGSCRWNPARILIPAVPAHPNIPIQDPAHSRGRKTRSVDSSLGSRSSLFPAWKSRERIFQEKNSSFPGIIPQNSPFQRENIPGASLNPSLSLGFIQRILRNQTC